MREPLFPLSQFPASDELLNELLKRYGGFPHLLDTDFEVPEEFLLKLEDLGYTRLEFWDMRSKLGQPEKDLWIGIIASCVQDLNNETFPEARMSSLNSFLPQINKHNITDEDIQKALIKRSAGSSG